jgi:hypothetical protein
MKYLVMVGVVVGAFLLGWLTRPTPPPEKPPYPPKTDTIFVTAPSIPEKVQELVFTPGSDVPFPVPYEVVIFQPDTVPCNEVSSRTRIMSAEFSQEYGDTSSVALEEMRYDNGSLVFQSKIERLYTDGMPRRMWIDSGRVKMEWVEYPVIRVNSCSIGKTLLSGLVGCGACSLLTGIN